MDPDSFSEITEDPDSISAWEDRFITDDEDDEEQFEKNEELNDSFSVDDLMHAVKVAGKVPHMVGADPCASLIAWGVPLTPSSPAAQKTPQKPRPPAEKTDNNGELLEVERRLSVKLDQLIAKVDRLSIESALQFKLSFMNHSEDMASLDSLYQDGDERRNRTPSRSDSDSSLLVPDGRRRTSSESTEKERRRTSSDSTERARKRPSSNEATDKERRRTISFTEGAEQKERRRTSSSSSEATDDKGRRRTSSDLSERGSLKRGSSEKELALFLPSTRTEKIFGKAEIGQCKKSPLSKDTGACDNYQLDYSAKSFGVCMCGYCRKDHGKRTSFSDDAPVTFTSSKLSSTLEADPPPQPLPQDAAPGACDKYQIDFSAKSFGMCVCGQYRKDHGMRTSILGVVERPASLRPTWSATSCDPSSPSSPSSPRSPPLPNQNALALPSEAYVALSVEILPPQTVVQKIGKQSEEKGKKHSPASVTGVFQKPSPPGPSALSGTISTLSSTMRTSARPCGEFTVDDNAEHFGMCVCGLTKLDHNEPKAGESAQSADATVDVYPEIKDLPEYRPYLDMIQSGVGVDTIAKKMRIKGLDPKKLHVGQDLPSEPKTSSPSKRDRGKSIYGISVLKGTHPPSDVDLRNREQHLSEEEFISVFGMYRDEFEDLAKWRRIQLKKSAELF
jgi:hypothetical protein